MIPVWMTFTFIQGHRITGKRKVVQSFCSKLHDATEMFMIVDDLMEMNDFKEVL